MVYYRAADTFITEFDDVTLGFSFFDTAILFKETSEHTLLVVQSFGPWYSNKKKGKLNERFFQNCAKSHVDVIHAEYNATIDVCEFKKAFFPAGFDDLLAIELQTTPTITETVRNLFFNNMEGFKYYLRQEIHKKPIFMSSTEGKVELLPKIIWVHFNPNSVTADRKRQPHN